MYIFHRNRQNIFNLLGGKSFSAVAPQDEEKADYSIKVGT